MCAFVCEPTEHTRTRPFCGLRVVIESALNLHTAAVRRKKRRAAHIIQRHSILLAFGNGQIAPSAYTCMMNGEKINRRRPNKYVFARAQTRICKTYSLRYVRKKSPVHTDRHTDNTHPEWCVNFSVGGEKHKFMRLLLSASCMQMQQDQANKMAQILVIIWYTS
jgi:hypothetical protein